MPHAVLTGARQIPSFDGPPLLHEGGLIYRVLETAESRNGWLLKCVIIHPAKQPGKFLARVDHREDGLVAHLDDHMLIERDDDVFRFLALIADAILRANPGSRVGKNNLEKWMGTHAVP